MTMYCTLWCWIEYSSFSHVCRRFVFNPKPTESPSFAASAAVSRHHHRDRRRATALFTFTPLSSFLGAFVCSITSSLLGQLWRESVGHERTRTSSPRKVSARPCSVGAAARFGSPVCTYGRVYCDYFTWGTSYCHDRVKHWPCDTQKTSYCRVHMNRISSLQTVSEIY